MKTQTRLKIIKLIEKNGRVRPLDLRVSLKLTGAAIHRHLRSLSEQGIIESKGSSPFTQYSLAGIPDLDAVSLWLNAKTLTENSQKQVSETRDVFSGRLPNLKAHVKKGLPPNILPLVISTAGEIGNNSFDHNLGQWRDVPGCWFEAQVTGQHLWICIADRGQGIFQSLVRAHPEIKNDQVALKAAFETIISGRSPERRGNGLKFVRENLSKRSGDGVACISGSGRVNYGKQGEKCATLLDRHLTKVKGTITLVVWSFE